MDSQDKPQTSPPQSNNQKLIIGLIAGILIGLFIAFYLLDYFPVVSTALINVLIALFLVSIIAILAFTWFKDQILARLFGKDFQEENSKEEFKNIYNQISQQYVGKLLEGFPEETQKKAKLATPRFLKLVLWAFTRSWALRLIVTIFVTIGGLLGAILLYNQNQLLVTQNERIEIQNNLIEAERRSSLVFLMSNVLDRVDAEIASQRQIGEEKSDTEKYSLSKPLISRIVALSRAFRPYRLLDGDTLSDALVSPERGQLLISLMENNLDSLTQNSIVARGDFSNAVVGQINLIFAKLSNAKLSNADFRNADFRNADFREADLSNAHLGFADLSNADLSGANLRDANLRDAELSNADLSFADLSNASFSGAGLSGANLGFADLSNAELSNTHLSNADLSNADLSGTKNMTVRKLVQVYSLFQCKSLNPELEERLKSERPCLFTEEGCKE